MNQNNLITFQRGHTGSEKVQQGQELRLSGGQRPGLLVPASEFLNVPAPSSPLGPAGFPGAIVRAGQVAPGRGTCLTAALHRGASLSGKEKGTCSSLPLCKCRFGSPSPEASGLVVTNCPHSS